MIYNCVYVTMTANQILIMMRIVWFFPVTYWKTKCKSFCEGTENLIYLWFLNCISRASLILVTLGWFSVSPTYYKQYTWQYTSILFNGQAPYQLPLSLSSSPGHFWLDCLESCDYELPFVSYCQWQKHDTRTTCRTNEHGVCSNFFIKLCNSHSCIFMNRNRSEYILNSDIHCYMYNHCI